MPWPWASGAPCNKGAESPIPGGGGVESSTFLVYKIGPHDCSNIIRGKDARRSCHRCEYGHSVCPIACTFKFFITCIGHIRDWINPFAFSPRYREGDLTLYVLNLHNVTKHLKLPPPMFSRPVDKYLLKPFGSDGLLSK